MANFNRVILAGNLTREPELRYTPQKSAVCEFTIAVNHTYTTSAGVEKEDTCFVECHCWGRRGEALSEHVEKGEPLLVEGRLEYDTWETPDGRRSKHTVRVHNWEFMGGGQ